MHLTIHDASKIELYKLASQQPADCEKTESKERTLNQKRSVCCVYLCARNCR